MKLHTITILMLALMTFIGCESDDPTSPPSFTPSDSIWAADDSSGGGYNVRLNAKSSTQYRYFDFTTRQVVDITESQAANSNAWHIGFNRFLGKINGGSSGTAGMTAVDMATLGLADSTNFAAVTTLPAIDAGAWQSDQVTLAIEDSDWWWYDTSNHRVMPTYEVFVIKTATGKWAKMMVDSIYGGSEDAIGNVRLMFYYQADGTTNLNGATQNATLDATTGAVYFSFASGGVLHVDNPLGSTAWDLKLEGYSIRLNSSSSGPGMAGALMSDTTFAATVTAPQGRPYNMDVSISIFGTETVNPWFNYFEGSGERLRSKRHVYLLKTSAGVVYKMQITGYYMVVGGTAEGGWMQFRYKQL